MFELYKLFEYLEMENVFILLVIILGLLLIKWVYQFSVWRRRENIEIELLRLLRDINRNQIYYSEIENEMDALDDEDEDEYIPYTKLRR